MKTNFVFGLFSLNCRLRQLEFSFRVVLLKRNGFSYFFIIIIRQQIAPVLCFYRVFVEFYKCTNANAVIWLAEPLYTISRISVQCLGVVDKIAMFPCFSELFQANELTGFWIKKARNFWKKLMSARTQLQMSNWQFSPREFSKAWSFVLRLGIIGIVIWSKLKVQLEF